MICNDCNATIKPGACVCRCGWKVPPRLQPMPQRAPDLRPGPRPGRASNPHVEAIREAYARSHACRTKMGIGQAAREVLNEMREPGEDREESNAVERDGGSQPVDARIERGSVPSQDAQARQSPAAPVSTAPALGIPWDDLEHEFADKGNP